MPSISISSPNVATFNVAVEANLLAGVFYIHASNSTFIGGGAALVDGVKIKITSPLGVVIKDYGVGFDIPAPLSVNQAINIPKQGGYSSYIILFLLSIVPYFKSNVLSLTKVTLK